MNGERRTPNVRGLAVLDIAWNTHASRIQNRIDALAAITDEIGVITRTFLSEATLRANLVVASWMREAGLTTSEDRVGNLLGQSQSDPRNSIFLLGSHLDTVRNAGRFDGPLGVLLAIEAVDILRSSNVALPFSPAVASLVSVLFISLIVLVPDDSSRY